MKHQSQSQNTCLSFQIDSTLQLKYPADIYMLKFNNKSTRTTCEICSELSVKTPERPHWCRFVVFTVCYERNLNLVLVFVLLILNM